MLFMILSLDRTKVLSLLRRMLIHKLVAFTSFTCIRIPNLIHGRRLFDSNVGPIINKQPRVDEVTTLNIIVLKSIFSPLSTADCCLQRLRSSVPSRHLRSWDPEEIRLPDTALRLQ